ncbi:MAG: isoleucine--tRNA ligase [Deltaproteobacteria bacterium]|jgi:isoleucyl-tRNA synthetase|nr:isoleucine--tRNA ligase [Deltaproteobacteria bacterium]
MDYKKTLNLPKTNFPMKAGLPKLEPVILDKWRAMDLNAQILAKREGRPQWVLHDGPPYANGSIHLGTALNKILKDIIVKAKSLAGFSSPYVPGWDCHGLPIEHQVEEELNKKRQTASTTEIRALCRKHAEKFVALQSEEFQRLGVIGDFQNPYLTMSPRYEAIIARELGQMALDGRLYHSVKPVLWCGHCRTALAEAEVDYKEITSASLFVAFPISFDPSVVHPKLEGKNVSLVIWTTTPWTIPSNLAIAYNPTIVYAAYDLLERVVIVSKERAADLWKKMGLTAPDFPKELTEIDPQLMDSRLAKHPLYDRESLIVSASYVTLEQGTGLVHVAPGHGREDFEVGVKRNLPIFSPLDDEARFTVEVPELRGRGVDEANSLVIAALREKNALLAQDQIKHSYPHCWRCHRPVIFRATPQWFVSMEEKQLRDQTLDSIKTVNWIPAWGRERILGMIKNRPDWCVSRQRSWGVPIPIFFCRDCGRWHYSQAIQRKLFDLFLAEGADAWFNRTAEELLPPNENCACGARDFDKENDILDVWFDSGSSFAAVMEASQSLPDIADLYLEGSDQHRGWFHSSLLVSMANRRRPPYRSVLTHGYVVDGDSRKMSKSEGNVISPKTIIDKYGADLIRLWVAAENYQDDIRISPTILEMLAKAYFNFRNAMRFILGNLYDFTPFDAAPYDRLSPIDRYILHLLSQVTEKILVAYESFAFHDVYQIINKFVGTLSSLYFDVVKDRLYTLAPNDPLRRATQTVMRQILLDLPRLMAPILSFTAEEIWGYVEPGPEKSVFLTDFPQPNLEVRDQKLANDIDSLIGVRDALNKDLEQGRRDKLIGSALESKCSIVAPSPTYDILKQYEPYLLEFFIISDLEISEGPNLSFKISVNQDPKCPRCWTRHPLVTPENGGVCPKCLKALAALE